MTPREEAAAIVEFIREYYNHLSVAPRLDRKVKRGQKHQAREKARASCAEDAAAAAETVRSPHAASASSASSAATTTTHEEYSAGGGGAGGAFAERAILGRLKQLATFVLRCNAGTEASLQPFLEQTDQGAGSAGSRCPHRAVCA